MSYAGGGSGAGYGGGSVFVDEDGDDGALANDDPEDEDGGMYGGEGGMMVTPFKVRVHRMSHPHRIRIACSLVLVSHACKQNNTTRVHAYSLLPVQK